MIMFYFHLFFAIVNFHLNIVNEITPSINSLHTKQVIQAKVIMRME